MMCVGIYIPEDHLARKWHSVNGYFLLSIFHCVPQDVGLDCACIWVSARWHQLIGLGRQIYISVSLKPGVPLSHTHFYGLQADTSGHQSWKSLRDSVDIFHSSTSMPEKMCNVPRPRPAAKLLPGPWPSAFNFLCRVSFCAFLPPLPRSLTALSGVILWCDQAPSNAERVGEVCVFENMCVVAQKGKNKCYQKPTTASFPRRRQEACWLPAVQQFPSLASLEREVLEIQSSFFSSSPFLISLNIYPKVE